MPKQESARLQILSGWKEIANYLGRGVRSVQRYEREMGLPIHRPAGKPLAAVVAIKAELDEWLTAPRTRVDSVAKRRALDSRTNKLRGDFLRIDSDIALTFVNVALGATSPAKRKSATETARKAYDTIMRFRKNTYLDGAEESKLEANLRRLKGELQSLGQKF